MTSEAAATPSFQAQTTAYLAQQTQPVIVPSFAGWFKLDAIHPIEERSLPEFFQSTTKYKSPEIYKQVRNFVIHTFRLNPTEYLSLTAIRRNVALDVASLMRIYTFLSKWGLINYQIDPKTKSFGMIPQFTGHFQVLLDRPSNLELDLPTKIEPKDDGEPLVNEDEEPANVKRQKLEEGATYNLSLRKNIYDSIEDAMILQEKSALHPEAKKIYCSITGNDITTSKYHNLKSKGNISTECFENGHFENYFKSSDFLKLDKVTTQLQEHPWSNQELLLLLEGIEMYQEDWTAVSAHVGSRSKDQCVSKFIQLPLEDKFINKQINTSSLKKYIESLKPTDTGSTLKGMLQQLLSKVSSVSTTTTTTTTTTVTFNDSKDDELKVQNELLTKLHKQIIEKLEIKLQAFEKLEQESNELRLIIDSEKDKTTKERFLWQNHVSEIKALLKNVETVTNVDELNKLVEEASKKLSVFPELTSKRANEEKQKTLDEDEQMLDANKEDDSNIPISVAQPKSFTLWSA